MTGTLIPAGECVIVHDNRFARVIAAWEKVGQHGRNWYLVTNAKFGWEIVPDYSVQLSDEDLADDGGYTVTVSELPENLQNRSVVDSSDVKKEYGWGFAVISSLSPDGVLTHTSLGRAGSGYPWWVVTLKDSFRLMDWSTVNWDTYPSPEWEEEWAKAVADSPKFPVTV